MNIVVSKDEFINALMNQQKESKIAKARKDQEVFMEYRKAKTQRLRKFRK